MEALEPRVLLSGTYYGWVGVESLPGYVAEYGEPDPLVGMSENGVYKWSASAGDHDRAGEPYIVLDHAVRYLQDDAFLQHTEIAGINSEGVVFGHDVTGDNAGSVFTYALGSRVKHVLTADSFDSAPGFAFADALPVGITDGGALLWKIVDEDENRARLWVSIDESVWGLWESYARSSDDRTAIVIDSNAANAVIGHRLDTNGYPVPMMWSPENGVIDLREQGLQSIGSINNDGTVFAKLISSQDPDRPLVLWRDGEIEVTEFEDNYEIGIGGANAIPRSRDASGRLIVRTAVAYRDFLDADDQFVESDEPSYFRLDQSHQSMDGLRLFESGSMLIFGYDDSSPQAGWYGFVSGEAYLAVDPDEKAVPWIDNGHFRLDARRIDGSFLKYSRDADGVDHTDVRWSGDEVLTDWDVMTSPVTGNMMLLWTDGRFTYFRGTSDARDGYGADRLVAFNRYIDRAVTGFFRYDGMPVVAGLDNDGALQLLYVRKGGQFPAHRVDLSAEHLAARGQETPAFVSQLDSFATPWGAMNIVGLDERGDLHAVWWSPGLRSPLWIASNLSELTGAPRLVGNITASATRWNGMQVFGTDERGHAISVWWSPTSGGWRWSDLTALADGRPIEAGTLAGAATRWGALEIIGRTDDNQIVTYWWAPGSGGWTFESITDQQVGDVPPIVGPLSLTVASDRSQHIAGVSAEGEVVHLYWLADGQDLWRSENLTELALQ